MIILKNGASGCPVPFFIELNIAAINKNGNTKEYNPKYWNTWVESSSFTPLEIIYERIKQIGESNNPIIKDKTKIWTEACLVFSISPFPYSCPIIAEAATLSPWEKAFKIFITDCENPIAPAMT